MSTEASAGCAELEKAGCRIRKLPQKLSSLPAECSNTRRAYIEVVVPKKDPGDYRYIYDMQPLNKVTIHDAGMRSGVRVGVGNRFGEVCGGVGQSEIEKGSEEVEGDGGGAYDVQAEGVENQSH